MKEKLLFVTKGGEDCDNGFPYILELAKTLGAGVSVLMVYQKHFMETYEDIMGAVAFAEAGEHEMVRELLERQGKEIEEKAGRKIKEMSAACNKDSIPFSYQVTSDEPVAAIRDFLRKRPETEMVLLSPNLSESKKVIDLKKLLKNITKPVVSMSRPIKATA